MNDTLYHTEMTVKLTINSRFYYVIFDIYSLKIKVMGNGHLSIV